MEKSILPMVRFAVWCRQTARLVMLSAMALGLVYGRTARAAWQQELPSVPNTGFQRLCFASSSSGYAVGREGVAWYDGADWSTMSTEVGGSDVYAASPNAVFVTGATSGRVSFYNGSSWQELETGDSSRCSVIWGSSATDVFASGPWDTVLHYDGASWVNGPEVIRGEFGILDGCSVSSSLAWGVGARGNYSADVFVWNGNVWTNYDTEIDLGGTYAALRSIWCNPQGDFLAVGSFDFVLAHPGSGGCYTIPVPSEADSQLGDVWGTSLTDFYVSDWAGKLFHYQNGSWSESNLDRDIPVLTVGGTSASDVFVTGDNGWVCHYDGVSWSSQTLGLDGWYYAVWGSGPDNVLACSSGDGDARYNGSEWTWLDSDQTSFFRDNSPRRVQGFGPTQIYGVGNRYGQGAIVSFNGMYWELEADCAWEPQDIWGTSPTDLFVVGEDGPDGLVFHYDGASWSQMNTSYVIYKLFAVWGAGPSDVFVVGEAGTIGHYDGGAAVWWPMSSGTTWDLLDVWGTSGQDVFAVGLMGTILHYNGSSWESMNSGTTEGLRAVWGFSGSDVYAVGHDGTILHYNGASWTAMASGSEATFYDVWGSASCGVYAVGQETVLHLASTGPWAGAVDLGSGWHWLDWFGSFYDAGNGWIYHTQHGWLFTASSSPASLWLWSADMGWLWTGSATYPYLYRAAPTAWLWYQRDTTNPRWFLNLATAQWEAH
ncbi:WD40/YVTN/BNR-like repeat-containing protein [Verrucomicrobiota bacterium]